MSVAFCIKRACCNSGAPKAVYWTLRHRSVLFLVVCFSSSSHSYICLCHYYHSWRVHRDQGWPDAWQHGWRSRVRRAGDTVQLHAYGVGARGGGRVAVGARPARLPGHHEEDGHTAPRWKHELPQEVRSQSTSAYSHSASLLHSLVFASYCNVMVFALRFCDLAAVADPKSFFKWSRAWKWLALLLDVLMDVILCFSVPLLEKVPADKLAKIADVLEVVSLHIEYRVCIVMCCCAIKSGEVNTGTV